MEQNQRLSHMDEYIGIHPDAPQSFGNFLRIRIFDKVPFKKVNYLNGRAESLGRGMQTICRSAY